MDQLDCYLPTIPDHLINIKFKNSHKNTVQLSSVAAVPSIHIKAGLQINDIQRDKNMAAFFTYKS